VLRVVYVLCPLRELHKLHVLCTEVVQHVMHVVNVFRGVSLLYAEGICPVAAGASMLNVYGVVGVVLFHTRYTV
jgi:hypothetical protein